MYNWKKSVHSQWKDVLTRWEGRMLPGRIYLSHHQAFLDIDYLQ